MKVIGAGVSRTGTMSLRYALDNLGFPCYHMEVAARNFERGDLDQWNEFMEGRSQMDWKSVLNSYEATTDAPLCFYYKELMEIYPEAKIVLTVRDSGDWYESLSKLMNLHNTLVEKIQFVPRFKAFQRAYRNLEKQLFKYGSDRESIIRFYNEHNDAVKAAVPEDKLLVFEVKDGYGPLCDFLGVPTPTEPFPHLNSGIAKAEKIMQQLLLQDLVKIYGPWVLGIAVVVILLIIFL